jgi:hypothetical protein
VGKGNEENIRGSIDPEQSRSVIWRQEENTKKW